ncbi:MAG TPA: PilN domain-containing protein [Chitinispirillaceae bacterium]|jgi:hypothetical protein|nr:PilN domain-containing protein [Chitinispirillaceae bacterium]
MKKMRGMVPSHDGSYIQATAGQSASGWKFLGCKTLAWNQRYAGVFKSSGTHLGVCCNWVRTMPSEQEGFAFAKSDAGFFACTQSFGLEIHKEILQNNLLGIYPDDVFMCTLPLYMGTDRSESFLSVFSENNINKTALIIDKKLASVFIVPESYPVNLFLKRIKYYWQNVSGSDLPETVYLFNDQNFDIDNSFSIRNILLPVNEPSEIKAMGLAFCGMYNTIPQISGPTEASRFRRFRAASLGVCALLIIIIALTGGFFLLLNNRHEIKADEYEKEYRSILANDSEIRGIISDGEKLSNKLLRISKISSSPTTWGRFLYLLGSIRPDKLYFEKLGSEPLSDTNDKIRVALAGWAESEIIVTDLIKKLNSSDLITHTSLSSMERDEKQQNLCRFRIICMLKLLNP